MNMELIEVLFFTQFLIVVGLFFYKLYSLMHVEGIKADFKPSFLSLIGLIMAYGLGSSLNILALSSTYAMVMNFERVLFILGVVFFIGELFIKIDVNLKDSVVTARNSAQEYKR